MHDRADRSGERDLDHYLADVRAAPTDHGRLELIVRRPAVDQREVLAEARLDPEHGLLGDGWAARGSQSTPDGSADPAAQLTVMSTRVLAAIEPDRERWPLAGDQLYVDLDLRVESLPAGSRLAIGSAVIEVSDAPHTGCAKFSARFGSDALRWINSPVGRAHRMRGLNARVVVGGTIRTGDAIRRLMDRPTWLAERRAAVRAQYDAEAAAYEQHGYPIEAQRRFVARLLAACPPGGHVLDAPCGTGIYFPMVAAAGRRVVGIDQSEGMLAQARAKGIAESLEQVGLQELALEGEFDAVMTVDAMENVSPEDWPLVLANLHRALRPGGHLYLTVEEVDEVRIDEALTGLRAHGVPAVRGEVAEGEVAGYHYYPGRDRVLGWLDAEGLDVVEEACEQGDGWGYRHFLLRAR